MNFSVGPSYISPEVRADIAELAESNVLEFSHRGPQFSAIAKKAHEGLREYFQIPEEYKIFFTASATEAIHLSIANCCAGKSFHYMNGFFSHWSYNASYYLGNDVQTAEVPWGESLDYSAKIPADRDLIAIEHNETSTGVRCLNEEMKQVKEQNPEALILVDSTSIAGGIDMNISSADLWCFSVQKCLGLPSGLGVMIVSPRAFERSLELQKQGKSKAGMYSLCTLWEMVKDEKYWTLATSNIFCTALLAEQVERMNKRGGMKVAEESLMKKWNLMDEFLSSQNTFSHFSSDREHLSPTIIVIQAEESVIADVMKMAAEEEILLSKGLGESEGKVIRIANFPSIPYENFEKLIEFLKRFV